MAGIGITGKISLQVLQYKKASGGNAREEALGMRHWRGEAM
jgi:hypothetical protein